MEIHVGEFKEIGINEIDTDLVINQWNHLWMLAEWTVDNEWRIIKFIRKDSEKKELKVTISWQQANELVKKLGLKSEQSAFKSGFSWR